MSAPAATEKGKYFNYFINFSLTQLPAQIINPSPWNDPPPSIPSPSTADLGTVRAGFHCKRVSTPAATNKGEYFHYFINFSLSALRAQITNPSPWNDPPQPIQSRSRADLVAVRTGFHCKRVSAPAAEKKVNILILLLIFHYRRCLPK